jgi:hypothetical protein
MHFEQTADISKFDFEISELHEVIGYYQFEFEGGIRFIKGLLIASTFSLPIWMGLLLTVF